MGAIDDAHVIAAFGYAERPDVPTSLRLARTLGLECPLEPDEAFFLSVIDLRLS